MLILHYSVLLLAQELFFGAGIFRGVVHCVVLTFHLERRDYTDVLSVVTRVMDLRLHYDKNEVTGTVEYKLAYLCAILYVMELIIELNQV